MMVLGISRTTEYRTNRGCIMNKVKSTYNPKEPALKVRSKGGHIQVKKTPVAYFQAESAEKARTKGSPRKRVL